MHNVTLKMPYNISAEILSSNYLHVQAPPTLRGKLKHLNEYLVLIQISEYLALLWVHAVKHLQAAYELGADRKFFHLVFMKTWYCITDERGRLETSLSHARFDCPMT